MKKIVSYREKLLELARIYNISEVKNYIKVKKNLTVLQLELILRKNKVPVPKEIHKTILEIQSKRITKPFYEMGNKINNIFYYSIFGIKKSAISLFKNIDSLISSVVISFFKFCSSVNRKTISILNGFYNFKVQEKKANTIVASVAALTVSISLIMFGLEVFKNFDSDKNLLTEQSENNVNKILKKEPKKEIAKIPEKKEPKKEIAKIPEKKEIPKQKKPNQLSELILPNLNLKTSEISEQHLQGQHTTTFAEMYDLSFDAQIIDTPGIKGFGIVEMEKEELADYFPEFFALKAHCKFHNCLHLEEPKCAVKEALEKDELAWSRYKSYLQILEGEDETYRKDIYNKE